MSRDIAARGIRRGQIAEGSVRIIYLRSATGDDANLGTSELDAVATMDRALELLTDNSKDLVQIIDATGHTETLDGGTAQRIAWNFPEGGQRKEDTFGDISGNINSLNFAKAPFTVRAEPELVQSVTITGYTTDPVTGHQTATVSETLTPNAHVGQILYAGAFAQWGIIHSNTANTIKVTSTGFLSGTGALGIYTQSCEFTVTADHWLQVQMGAYIQFNRIRFLSGGADSRVVFYGNGDMLNLLCAYETESLLTECGGGLWSANWCYINTTYAGWEGQPHALFYTVFTGVEWTTHGSGGHGQNALNNCVLDGCTSYGALNYENAVDIEVENCHILNGTGAGVTKASPFQGRVANCLIENCAGNAISAVCGGGRLLVSNVTGSGNGGHGIGMSRGTMVQVASGTDVTGTDGDIEIGEVTQGYADVPVVDAGTLSQVF